MGFARILDIRDLAYGQVGIHKVRIGHDESSPFKVLWHSDRTGAQTLDDFIVMVCLALEDTSKGVVSLLDLADDDGL